MTCEVTAQGRREFCRKQGFALSTPEQHLPARPAEPAGLAIRRTTRDPGSVAGLAVVVLLLASNKFGLISAIPDEVASKRHDAGEAGSMPNRIRVTEINARRKETVTAKLAGLRGDIEDLLAAEQLAGRNAVLSAKHLARLTAVLKHITQVELSLEGETSFVIPVAA